MADRGDGVSNWGPAFAYTKDEHDLFVSIRGRNITDDPMKEAAPRDFDSGSPSLIDTYIQPKGDL